MGVERAHGVAWPDLRSMLSARGYSIPMSVLRSVYGSLGFGPAFTGVPVNHIRWLLHAVNYRGYLTHQGRQRRIFKMYQAGVSTERLAVYWKLHISVINYACFSSATARTVRKMNNGAAA